jgi:hypothetical protein
MSGTAATSSTSAPREAIVQITFFIPLTSGLTYFESACCGRQILLVVMRSGRSGNTRARKIIARGAGADENSLDARRGFKVNPCLYWLPPTARVSLPWRLRIALARARIEPLLPFIITTSRQLCHWDAFSRHIRYGEKRSPAGKLYHYHIEVVAATSRKSW